MADENLATDLFGEPVVSPRERPGRPEIVWNRQGSDLAILGFARGLTVKEVAGLLGLSQPTFRKVYFSECRKRKLARLRVEMLQLTRLNNQAAAGNVGAERELARRLDQLRMRDSAAAQASAPPMKEPKLGKKAEADRAAREQTGLYEPPPAPPMPGLLN